ncbi:acyl carrier protein [Aspergillus fumigatus Af293]|uniref:Acyl carrier protein n=2 Tax=Aspergillus fumigatus TaxID=746128 RepID=Q4WJA9_ASPFU|nr:acyl carrier protein, putative [Aspergillus fumigatus Af293]EAL88373.1 acyl carrier protein, putative [Aspergillus fumigatus Af293]EDP55998.1 acyl carrier protein, putative [Aspergillus fumigatus A1163]
MFRSAVVRSLRASVPRAVRTPAAFQIRSSPVARPAQFAPRFAYQGVRLYSAPAGLNKEEVEGRIVNLLKNFDKVRSFNFFSLALSGPSDGTAKILPTMVFEYQITDAIDGVQVSDASKINGSSHFSNDLGLDSLDTVEVVMAIEEEFSIEIPDKEADAIHSGKYTRTVPSESLIQVHLLILSTVDKAVEYILAQPDGKFISCEYKNPGY